MTEQEIQDYYQTKDGKEVREFIERDKQDAVVYSVTFNGTGRLVKCYSPVWKDILIWMGALYDVEVQRGDIITVSRYKVADDRDFKYKIVENKNASEIKEDGMKKILAYLSPSQKQNLILISEYQKRWNNSK